MATEFTLGELAERFGLEMVGDPATRITGVASLGSAGANQLAFAVDKRFSAQLAACQAAAVVVPAALVDSLPGAGLVATNAHAAFARIAALFDRRPAQPAGIHPGAVVEAGAMVDPGASIGPGCVVQATARIEAGAVLGPQCLVGPGCVVGAQSRLVARVTLVEQVSLGQRVVIHPGAVLGADGFGLAFDHGAWLKVPQLGGVRIGDDCEIGANTTIDRGALEDTVLEEDVRVDNLVQIAHNVRIGAHTAIAGCVGIAGSARIGRYCLIGGAVGIAGHLEIGDRVTVLGMTLVSHSLAGPGEYSSGMPAQESRRWRRTVAHLRRFDRRRGNSETKDEDR